MAGNRRPNHLAWWRLSIGHCQPAGKMAYATRRTARAVAKGRFPGERLHAYQCEHGDHWHIGHRAPAYIRGLP